MADTMIEWCDKVWNPTRGCALVSAGCARCYAMRQAHRFSGTGQPYEGLTKLGPAGRGAVWTGEARFVPEMLEAPLRWKKPARIFVNSMSDLGHEDLDAGDVAKVFAVMARAPRHTFQVLTKRAAHMRHLLSDPMFREEVWKIVMQRDLDDDREISEVWPLRNVWLGVSVEDQRAADERIPELLATPAAVRWLSVEPLIGPVRLDEHFGSFGLDKTIDWVVVGGESGTDARPMHPEWARRLRDQCVAAGVPFHFKQWGAWAPAFPQYGEDAGLDEDDFDIGEHAAKWDGVDQVCLEADGGSPQGEFANGEHFCLYQPRPSEHPWWMARVGKKRAGRLLDGREWNEYPGVRHA